jgi:hypothetical protein
MFIKMQEHLIKMKQNTILTILFMLISSILLSQHTSNIILHAYSREVSGGTMPSTSNNPNGNKKPFYYYFIYLETPPGQVPVISSIFLKGSYYIAQIQKVKTPVIISIINAEDKEVRQTLVKQTKNIVYQVVVTEDDTNLPPPPATKNQANTNDAFIKGNLGGRTFILTKKKLHQLPTLFVQ